MKQQSEFKPLSGKPHFLTDAPPRRVGRLPRHGEAFWRQVILDCELSGLSAGKFCEQRGLAKATFFKWRKVLRLQSNQVSSQCESHAVGSFLQIAAVTHPSSLPSEATLHDKPDLTTGANRNTHENVALTICGVDFRLTGQYAERVMRIITQRLSAGAFR